MSEAATPDAVGAAVAALYSGPLEDFIRERAALARAYRSAGHRDIAEQVKTLRKPARLAWALNLAIAGRPATFEALDGAVAAVAQAHASGEDARAAMTALHAAVRELAAAAAEAALRAGHDVDAASLSTAILAVLGSREPYAHLRDGRLAEIPEGGGLDALDVLPTHPTPAPRAPAPSSQGRIQQRPDAALSAESARAAEALAGARARAAAASEALQTAKSELAAAEQRVREAERELEAVRRRHENAGHEAAVATAALEMAEAAYGAQRKARGGREQSRT